MVVVFPSILMMDTDYISISLLLKGLTLTATFTLVILKKL